MADYDDGNFFDGECLFIILAQLLNQLAIDVDEGVVNAKQQPQKTK